VVKPELGTKRTCPNCSARFYDLEKDPIVCPKCAYAFVAEALLPSKSEQAVAPMPVAKPAPADADDEEFDDVELVSLDEIEPEDKDDDDDDVVAIEDVEIVDDDVKDDDTFLEDDDEEGPDVSGIIGVSDDEEDV